MNLNKFNINTFQNKQGNCRSPEEQLELISKQDQINDMKAERVNKLFNNINKKVINSSRLINNHKKIGQQEDHRLSNWDENDYVNKNKNNQLNKNNDQQRSYNQIFKEKIRYYSHSKNSQCGSKANKELIYSMADLCHRYTFINQHSSQNKALRYQSDLDDDYIVRQGEKIKLKSPPKLQIKLQLPEEYIRQKYYQTKGHKSSINGLPMISSKNSVNQQNHDGWQKDIMSDSEQIQKMLKLMNKTDQKRGFSSNFIHDKNDQQVKNNETRDTKGIYKIGWKPKIHRKNSREIQCQQHQNITKLQTSNTQLTKKVKIPQNNKNNHLFIGRVTKNRIQMEQKIDRFFHRSHDTKINKKLSKQLQQCLIFSKKQ